MANLPDKRQSDLIERRPETNPALVYLASLAETGRRSMRSRLESVAELLGHDRLETVPWAELDYEHLQALRTKLSENYAPASVNTTLSGLRGVLRAAWRLGQITGEHYQRATDVGNVTGSRLPAGRRLTSGELSALMKTCAQDNTPAGARDAAIIALAYAAGLRRAELADLRKQDLTRDGQTWVVRVLGKRDKERLAYVDNGAAQALEAWLQVRGDSDGPLFWRGRRGGHLVTGKGLSAQAVRNIIVRRAEEAGVKHCTPHDLRRSFVSDLLAAGVDLATVSNMAGHESIDTTARYDRRGEEAKRQGATRLHVPFYGN
jgi:site-specific recombinase XerD